MDTKEFETKLTEFNQLHKQPEIIKWKLQCATKELQVTFADRLNYLSQRLCQKDFVESGAEFVMDDQFCSDSPLKVAIPQTADPAKRKEIYLANVFFTSNNWKNLADCYLNKEQYDKQWKQFVNIEKVKHVFWFDTKCHMFGEYILEEGRFESADNRFARLKPRFDQRSQYSQITDALKDILLDVQPELSLMLTDGCIEVVMLELSEFFTTKPVFNDLRLRSYIDKCANKSAVRAATLKLLEKKLNQYLK